MVRYFKLHIYIEVIINAFEVSLFYNILNYSEQLLMEGEHLY